MRLYLLLNIFLFGIAASSSLNLNAEHVKDPNHIDIDPLADLRLLATT
ncbi:hypothetical protein PI125_g6748 [Phytophthora idaei]|nr:hypothetical protein PI125_g6748 [Phytophthora idaei]KAG3169718.1 hypothetical protein PI126_g2706 [Phytophthora idaei]